VARVESLAKGILMRIAVDLVKCENHGQCMYAAPDVFALNDNGELTFRETATDEYRSGELDEALRKGIEEAIDMCPVRAIRDLDDER
jgi:ferredoxin